MEENCVAIVYDTTMSDLSSSILVYIRDSRHHHAPSTFGSKCAIHAIKESSRSIEPPTFLERAHELNSRVVSLTPLPPPPPFLRECFLLSKLTLYDTFSVELGPEITLKSGSFVIEDYNAEAARGLHGPQLDEGCEENGRNEERKIMSTGICAICIKLPCSLEESLRGTVRLFGMLSTKDLGTMLDPTIASGSLASS
ncbi:hypothetical protein ALC57_14904 [Trachymyrmex cornetzi]|uniref:Uncharacterized protein n=1 Tax=Trachymyrmex cornetzi TaxID=471704 RepID=A0A195DK26_9HYME|nr:hypothetical protein ALC57_14904 [Trachymyrmex cornetzi]